MALPLFLPVRQNFPNRSLKDIPETVQKELASSGLASRLAPGARVAVAVGSRGIANIAEITGAVVGFWKSAGFHPFIFPAMGSHGGGTGEGQAHTLAGYGITESTMRCPVVSSLEVLSLGASDIGAEAWVSRDAWQSDGVFMIGRVKWHTSFAGPLESGLTKMIAIGLGKLEGARTAHAHARRLGMDNVIRSVGSLVLSQGKILGGLAILEGFSHETAHLEVLPSERLIAREVELLELAKSWMPKIPVPAVDLLIIDEIGKNISGTGMDLKVVNRGAHGQYNPWPDTPKVERIFIRSLTTQSGGNAVGMGLADAIHDRMLERVDVSIGRLNALTSGSIATVRTPLHFPSDREGVEFLSATVGKLDDSHVTMAWIRNTIEVGELALSENLRGEIEKNPMLEITGPVFPLSYDSAGNLPGAV